MFLPAFTFGAPALLWGMGLAGVPLLIHLLHRRRFREMYWAAMPWLLEAIRKHTRRLRLEQFLLLLARTAIILLVVLAMARPSFEAARSLFVAETIATHHVIVFDNTMSMHYRVTDVSRWERGKQIAQSILDDAQTGDLASVLTLGTKAAVLVGDPSPNLSSVASEIEAISPEHGAARVDAAVDKTLEILANSRSARKRIYWITDLQRIGWTGSDAGGGRAELGKKLQRVSELADFVLLDVGAPDSPNLALLDLQQQTPLAVGGRPTLFRLSIGNYSPQSREDVRVELFVDGQVEVSQNLSIGAGEQATLTLPVTFREAGQRVVEARIRDDALRIDDRRDLVALVRDSLEVLVIDGAPSGEHFRSEADYLRVALSPRSDEPGTLIRSEVRLESDLLETQLDDYDLVVLCNVTRLADGEIAVLREFLRGGGGVLFFCGDRVDPAAYQRLSIDDGGIFPCRFLEQVGGGDRQQEFHFDPLDYAHPIIEPFRDHEQAGLLTTKIFGYLRVQPTSALAAAPELVMAFTSGDPAILLADVGGGTVGVVTTSADLDWNNWAVSPSFVPVVHELVRRMVRGRVRRPGLLVGDPLTIPILSQVASPTVLVTPPGRDARGEAVQLQQRDAARLLEYAATGLSGIYRIQVDAEGEPEYLVAVNPPPEESDLSKLTADDLRSLFPGWDFTLQERWQGMQSTASAVTPPAGQIHRLLLYGALGLLFAETLMAWRFGRS